MFQSSVKVQSVSVVNVLTLAHTASYWANSSMDKLAFAPFVSIDTSPGFKFYRRAITFHNVIGVVYVKIQADVWLFKRRQ